MLGSCSGGPSWSPGCCYRGRTFPLQFVTVCEIGFRYFSKRFPWRSGCVPHPHPFEVQPARSHEGGEGAPPERCCREKPWPGSWQEQACIREQAADCLLDGKQVPNTQENHREPTLLFGGFLLTRSRAGAGRPREALQQGSPSFPFFQRKAGECPCPGRAGIAVQDSSGARVSNRERKAELRALLELQVRERRTAQVRRRSAASTFQALQAAASASLQPPRRRETLVPSPAGTPTPATPATPVAPAAAPAAAAAAAAPKVPVGAQVAAPFRGYLWLSRTCRACRGYAIGREGWPKVPRINAANTRTTWLLPACPGQGSMN